VLFGLTSYVPSGFGEYVLQVVQATGVAGTGEGVGVGKIQLVNSSEILPVKFALLYLTVKFACPVSHKIVAIGNTSFLEYVTTGAGVGATVHPGEVTGPVLEQFIDAPGSILRTNAR
jgi:hypothetical protein